MTEERTPEDEALEEEAKQRIDEEPEKVDGADDLPDDVAEGEVRE